MHYHHCWFILSYSLMPKKWSGMDLHGHPYQQPHRAALYPSPMQKSKEGQNSGLCFKERSNYLAPLVHGLLLTAALKGNEEKQVPAASWEILQLLPFQRNIHLLCEIYSLLRARGPASEDLALYFCLHRAEQCTIPYFWSQVNSRFYPRAVHS